MALVANVNAQNWVKQDAELAEHLEVRNHVVAEVKNLQKKIDLLVEEKMRDIIDMPSMISPAALELEKVLKDRQFLYDLYLDLEYAIADLR